MTCPITLTNTSTSSFTINDLGFLTIPANTTINIGRYYSREKLVSSDNLESAITASTPRIELKYAGIKLSSVSDLCISIETDSGDARYVYCYLLGDTNTIDTDFLIQNNVNTYDLPVHVPVKSRIESIAADTYGYGSPDIWSFNVEIRKPSTSSAAGTIIVPAITFDNTVENRTKFPGTEILAGTRLRFRFLNSTGTAVSKPSILVKLREIS